MESRALLEAEYSGLVALAEHFGDALVE